jgi:NifU-like protein involved in Fe-S cluster formation
MVIKGQSGTPGQGPFMILYFDVAEDGLREGNCVEDGLIEKAWFETYGCPSAIRCGDWVSKWAVGRTLAKLQVMEAQDLLMVVGGLPLGKEFCTQITVEALRDASTGFAPINTPNNS